MWKNVEKCGKMCENVEKCVKMWKNVENVEKCGKMCENVEKCVKMCWRPVFYILLINTLLFSKLHKYDIIFQIKLIRYYLPNYINTLLSSKLL